MKGLRNIGNLGKISTLLLLGILFACAQVPRITGLSVAPGEATILVGESVRLEAEVEGLHEPSLAVTWSSSDESVAVVDDDGDVTGRTSGTVTITAASVFDDAWSDGATIHVADMLVELDPTHLEMEIDDVTVLTATVRGAVDDRVTWNSSDPAVATVNAAGVVVAIGEGSATIRAASVLDPEVAASATVAVARPPEPNDTPGTATPIALDYNGPELEITHGDIDYFTFTLAEPATVLAQVNAWDYGSPLDAMLTLYDDIGQIEESHDHCNGWDCFPDPLLLVELDAGTYYLAVEGERWGDGAAGWYTLGVEIYTGSIPEIDRTDLHLEVVEGSTATATFTLGNTGEGDLTFTITEEYDHESIAFVPESGTVAPGESVEITVEVDATERRSHEWLDTQAVIETNSPIVPEIRFWVGASIRPALVADPDNMYLEVLQGELIESSITLSNVGSVELDFDIAPHNSDGFLILEPELGTLAPGASTEIAVRVDTSVRGGGWHYDGSTIRYGASSEISVWVEVRVVSAPDVNEPNDTRAEATAITLDFASPELTITPNDDDHFVFTLTDTSTLTIDVDASQLESNLDPYLGLFDEFGNTIEVNDDHDGLDSWIERTLDAGTYYVVVSGCCGFGGHGQDGFYFLEVTATP